MSRRVLNHYAHAHEAELDRTALEAVGITAFVDNAYVSSVLPGTGAFGGVSLIVDEADFAAARQTLGLGEIPLPASEPRTLESQTRSLMKRAGMGAILGGIVLPVIANAFSFHLLWKAYRLDRKTFFAHPGSWVTAAVINLIVIGAVLALVAIYWETSSRTRMWS